LWLREFGGSQDVLGRTLRLGQDIYTIVGVAPPGFHGIDFKRTDVWVPIGPRASAAFGRQWKTSTSFLLVIARVKQGVRREQVNERATAAYRATRTFDAEKNNTIVLGDLRPARAPGAHIGTRVEVLIAGMSILVLFITCGNVANLLLVRGLRRDREFAVKMALGATRARLLREVGSEAVVLASSAGLVAFFVIIVGGGLVRREFLSPVAALASPVDLRLVLVTVAFCVAAVFLLGLAPALRLTTPRVLNPGRTIAFRPSLILDFFSGTQIALSLPLIIAAALFVVSLYNASHQDLGMQTRGVAIVTTNLLEVGRPLDSHVLHRKIQERLTRLPQVEAVAMVQSLPMQSVTVFLIDVPGRDDLWKSPVSSDVLPSMNPVDPSYFHVMRMRLVDGRFFTDAENRKGERSVAVITESMAQFFWPDQRAVGKCFYMSGRDNPCTEVVGVLADARLYPSIRPTKDWASAYYVPIEQSSGTSSRALLVRIHGDPTRALQTLRSESQLAGPDLPYVEAWAFDDIFKAMLKPWRLGSIVFGVFGAVSLLVSAIGVGVVSAYAVARRTREIAIRSALGAEPEQLVRLVLRRTLFVVASGLGIGFVLAWSGGKILAAQLFGITAGDLRVFAGAAFALLLIGCGAAWIPARRAARVRPAVALAAQ
jgi:predicted permease